jgi:hypothetical protein
VIHRLLLVAAAATAVAPDLAPGADAPARPAAASPAPQAEGKAAGAKPEARGDVAFAQLRAPLFDERFAGYPIALVDDDVIELRELTQALAGAHESRAAEPAAGKAGKTDFTAILDRIVDTRLIVADARDTGMDELPEIAQAVAEFKENALTEALKAHATKGARPDPAEVERLFRASVREWKVRSVLFPKQPEAIKAAAQVEGGRSFDDVARQAVADGVATGGEGTDFVRADKMLPRVAAALEQLEVGKVSAPLEVAGGWTLVRLEAVRYPDDPKARAEAEQRAQSAKKGAALKSYYAGLVKKWVKIDEALLKSIDYDAPRPGLEALRKDKRVVARIQGEKPITVAQLTTELEKQFFHGIKEAVDRKKANRQKLILIDALISRVVVPKEARRLGLGATDEYRRKAADYQNSLLFGTYVAKAIAPGVKVEEQELKSHYEQHKADYAYPAFYRAESLAFPDVKAAQSAVDKLRAGTDFKWLKANVEGQLREQDRTVRLEGSLVSARALPEELAKVLAGSKKGDVRLYSERGGHYVVQVLDEVPASTQPFSEVRASIAEQVVAGKIDKAIQETAAKLRGAHEVKLFIMRIGS